MRRLLPLAALAPALLCALGCQGPAAAIVEAPLGGRARFAPILPDTLDLAAAELAEATLAGDAAGVAAARDELVAAEQSERGEDTPSGLVPFGLETAGAVLAPGRREARAMREALLEREDLEPPLRKRLERQQEDDPLELARGRLFDARYASFARVFNAVSAPVGRGLLNPIQLPYTLGYSLARVAVDSVDGDALDLRRRQVLVYWIDFTERHPDNPEVAELAPRIAAYQEKWEETRADVALERALDALDAQRNPAALIYAARSLRHRETGAAREALEEAQERLDAEQRARNRSLGVEAPAGAPVPGPGEREAIAAALAEAPLPPEPGPALADAVRFLDDSARADSARTEDLEALAEKKGSLMARHAAAELADPLRHPERAYHRARSAERWRTTRWVLLGPLSRRPERGGAGLARYVLDLPLRLQAMLFLPVRALELSWRKPPPGHTRAAAHARRYLSLYPEGREAESLRSWLENYERSRKNWMGVLRLAQADPEADPEEIAELRERAAEQGLEVARAENRRDYRRGLLAHVTRAFPDTEAGREAGLEARKEAFEGTPHEIRFSRGFLLENPEIAGPRGFDLSPALLDDDPRNGELHPDGVALTGGREVEVSLLAASGDDDDAPQQLYALLPPERLSQLVARVEETRFRKALLDPEEALVADPQRDAVFERARLGLADSVDTRAGAEARHTYLGVRERYGMVRARDSILPVQLVVQGSLYDLSLGAFPRLVPPRQSPDAELFRD